MTCKTCGYPCDCDARASRESHVEPLRPELGAHSQIYLSIALAEVMQAFGALSPSERADVRKILAMLLDTKDSDVCAGLALAHGLTFTHRLTDPIRNALRAIDIVVSCLDP